MSTRSPAVDETSNDTAPQITLSHRGDPNRSKSCPRTIRFNTSLLIVLTMGLVECLIIAIGPSILSAPLAIALCLFAHEWNIVHSPALTRVRRAYFDVANVLETYQPRARTMGHLFDPEPPTPGNVKFAEGTENHDSSEQTPEFKNARDAHYANMYEHAVKMAKEMDALERAAGSPGFDAGQQVDVLVEADPKEDQKKANEKKKKEEDEYKKKLDKPFSC